MAFDFLWNAFGGFEHPGSYGSSELPFPPLDDEEDDLVIDVSVFDSSEADFELPQHLSKSGRRLKELYFTRDENSEYEEILEIPDFFSRFTNLRCLDLRGHKLALANDSVLFELKTLKHLYLARCRLKKIPDAISEFEHLESLDLEDNFISNLPESLFSLTTLIDLTLSSNSLTQISSSLNNLFQLQKLDVSRNHLTSFPDITLQNMQLKKLVLWHNELTSLNESISNLQLLQHLDISQNYLLALPDSIGELTELRLLSFANNSITYLPESITGLSLARERLILNHNPLQKPPLDECMKGMDTIRGYFEALNTFSGYHSNRAKVILLGESMAGKTSLCRALVNGKAEVIDVSTRTEGIDLYQWKVRPEIDNLEAFVVDCAGQRKYIMTHEFFISQGSLFLVVVDIYKYEMSVNCYREKVGNWIDLTLAHVPDAAIIIVPTHLDLFPDFPDKDNRELLRRCQHLMTNVWEDDNSRSIAIQMTNNELDRSDIDHHVYSYQLLAAKGQNRRISSAFEFGDEMLNFSNSPNEPIRMIPISLQGGLEGISELRKEIIKVMTNPEIMPLVGREIPTVYADLEEYCVKLRVSSPVVKSDVLIKMAEEQYGMNKEMTMAALQYLDTTGSLLYFSYADGLDRFTFLDPEWFVQVFKKLFCYDIEKKLIFDSQYSHSYQITAEDYEQLKEDLLNNARLNSTLLRCVWSEVDEIVDNEDVFQSLVDILNHFHLFIQLSNDNDILGNHTSTFLVPWFFKPATKVELGRYWPHQKKEGCVEITCQFDSIVSPFPVGSFEHFVSDSYHLFSDFMAWDNALLGIQPNCKVLCTVMNNGRCGRMLVKGRCKEINLDDLWSTILLVIKVLQDFFNHLPGLGHIKYRSICPSCISKSLPNPHMFTVQNWFALETAKEHIPCPKEHKLIPCHLLLPPKRVINSVSSVTGDGSSLISIKDGEVDLIMLDQLSQLVGTRHKKLGRCLGLSHHKIQIICYESRDQVTEQTMGMFTAWIEKVGRAATIKKLYQCIMGMKPRATDLLDFISEWKSN